MAYTGYIVRKYIDENPNSPTYGETWTEKTLDTTHCPNDGGGWSLVATECELVTSGFTGYRIDTYYNSVTNDYRTERTLDSICHASTNDEIWYNIGDVYCEQNDDGTYTGYGIQEQKQINPNLYNFGIVRKTRVASPECQEHLEPEWQDIQKECNIVQEIGTGTLHYDGTANILQIDINPSSPTFNQTRTINVEDEECEYVPCDRMEYEWHLIEETCGSLIPDYYRIENLVPDTVYKVYQMYSTCYIDDIVIRERPENVYSAVTYQEGVTDCLYRWLQTEQTVCESSTNHRWVNSGTTCEDANKYNLQVKEVTEDGGQTWSATSETRLGTMIEANSYDCGYRTRTESGSPYCDYSNYNKCVRVYNQVSKDSGQTWETTSSRIEIVEEHSAECGYVDYSREYLTIVALEDDFTFHTSYSGNVYYSLDSGTTWTAARGSGYVESISVNTGDKIMFKGNITRCHIASRHFNSKYNIEGNVMSIIYGDSFIGKTSLSGATLYELFAGDDGIINAKNLILPATSVPASGYSEMFSNCDSIITAPELPATTLGEYCYKWMFNNCESLISAPSRLPATTLAYGCYRNMFQGCTSLTSVPSNYLPAMQAQGECYGQMFYYCTSLTTAPNLPATTLAYGCYASMFCGCASLTQTPVLPARALVDGCYNYMFQKCTALNYAKCLATDISDTCTRLWLYNTAENGTFVKDANTTWSRGVDGIPSGWSIQNA